MAAVAFLAIMAGLYLASWYLQRPAVKQFPPDVAVKVSSFMLSVPANVVHFRAVNLTEARTLEVGNDMFANKTMVSLAQPDVNITTDEVTWVTDIEVLEGVIVNVMRVTSEVAIQLSQVLNASGVQWKRMQGIPTYRVRTMNETWATVAIVNETLIYSEQTSGQDAGLSRVLGAILSNETRLFDDQEIRKAYYVASQDGRFFALSFTDFEGGTGASSDVDWVFSFARYKGQRIDKVDMYKLASQQDAINSFDEVRSMYFVRAQSSYIIGDFIVVGQDFSLEDLRTVVMSL